MSRARHKAHKALGGGVKPVWNAGGEQNAAKEAEEKKKGGAVSVHGEGEKGKHRSDRPKRRAKGGKVEHDGHIEHEHSGHVIHHHRAKGGRVRGEGVGADRMPLSSAAKIKEVTKGEEPEDAEKSD